MRTNFEACCGKSRSKGYYQCVIGIMSFIVIYPQKISQYKIISINMDPKPNKLLDRVHGTMRLKQYSNKTEQATLNWIKQYIHPKNISTSKCY